MATKILLPIDHTDDRSWKAALPAALDQAKFYRGRTARGFGHPGNHSAAQPAPGYGSGAKPRA